MNLTGIELEVYTCSYLLAKGFLVLLKLVVHINRTRLRIHVTVTTNKNY